MSLTAPRAPIEHPGAAAPFKRVLIVAYHYPPAPLAGSLRPSFLVRYLPQFGWEATVLTKRRETNGDADPGIITAPDALERFMQIPAADASAAASNDASARRPGVWRRVRTGIRELAKSVLLFPDRASGWIPAATRAALRITRQRHFDAIISTSPPVSAHVVAGIVAMRRGLPWIADYRDLWRGNPYVFEGWLRAMAERVLERFLRAHACAFTTVNHELLVRQEREFGRCGGTVIPAGFDPAEWRYVHDEAPTRFALCYAGLLYEGRRRLDVLLTAIRELRDAGDPAGMEAYVDYYGPDVALVRGLAEQHGLADRVACHGFVERPRVMDALRRSAALLVLLNMDPSTASELGSKIFECVGARRPVIAIGPPGSVVSSFVERHRIGWFASNVVQARLAVRNAYAIYVTGRSKSMCHPAADDLLTARDVARRFATILEAVTDRHSILYRPS